jgi:hypothetical protein
MAFTPNTEVRLLSVPLNNGYEHTLDFSTITEQANYFVGKVKHSSVDCTYQRETSTIRFPEAYDNLYNCNYVMYRNINYSTKWFYGFITKRTYVNPNMTEIEFELDVYQTWMFDIKWSPSFIEREHCKRWNSDGTPVVNTIDEGLNYGSEYVTVSAEQYVPYTNTFWLVIVSKERVDTNSGGSKITPVRNGSPQPLTYYVHPFRMDGTTPNCLMDGMQMGLSSVTDVLKSLYTQTTMVNQIVSLYVTEYFGVNLGNSGGDNFAIPSSKFDMVTIQDATKTINTLYVKDIKEYEDLAHSFGSKYVGYTWSTESKLFMYPYTLTVLSDMKGNHIELKNEYVQSTDLVVSVKGSLGTSNKTAYMPNDYLINGQSVSNSREVGLERAIINNNPNDVPIITDLLAAYIQGNRNTIVNQAHSIAFNSIFGAVGNALTRNVGGAIANAGSSYFEVQGMLAKQKDIDNTPPSMNGLGSNTAFDYGNDLKGLYVIKKEITQEYRKKIEDYFKTYGYKVNEVKLPNLKTRQNFNFVKTVGANIQGDIPNQDLDKIREIFNKGVTIWHGDYVGDYTKVNADA